MTTHRPSALAPSRLRGPPQPEPAAPDLVALLARAARTPIGVTFVGLHEEETQLSWSDVHARSRRVAAGLERLGVGPGERVALVLRTEPAFLDAFFGTLLAGAVPVPLYPPVRLGRLDEYVATTARMITVSGARLVLASASVKPLLGEVVARSRPALGCRSVDALRETGGVLERASRPDALAVVQFSSGSTVEPKPVALTHGGVVAQISSFLAELRPDGDDVLVSWLPLYHDMGLIGGLLGALAYPGPAVLLAPEHFLARPALWLRTLSRCRGTISAAPDFAYAYAAARVRDADLDGVDLSCWRIALDGAEPISAEALRRFAARFGRFGFDARALTPVYGLSEATLAVTFTPPGRGWRSCSLDPGALATRGSVVAGSLEVVSVGVPVAGVEVEVRGSRGEVVAQRTLGRILVRSRSAMRGYLGDAGCSAGDRWLDTGDLGFVADGELFVHGRAKDVVIVRGANHAPDEFEAPLVSVAGVRTGCAVAVGKVGEDGREQLVVLVERSGPAADDAETQDRVREALLGATGIAPDEVVLLAPGTLPRTSSGKLRRGEALRRHLAGALTPPRRMSALGLAAAVLRSTVSYARTARGSGA